jgi:hypothetical protein
MPRMEVALGQTPAVASVLRTIAQVRRYYEKRCNCVILPEAAGAREVGREIRTEGKSVGQMKSRRKRRYKARLVNLKAGSGEDLKRQGKRRESMANVVAEET